MGLVVFLDLWYGYFCSMFILLALDTISVVTRLCSTETRSCLDVVSIAHMVISILGFTFMPLGCMHFCVIANKSNIYVHFSPVEDSTICINGSELYFVVLLHCCICCCLWCCLIIIVVVLWVHNADLTDLSFVWIIRWWMKF